MLPQIHRDLDKQITALAVRKATMTAQQYNAEMREIEARIFAHLSTLGDTVAIQDKRKSNG